MRPGLAKLIEKVRTSRYFESSETDHHKTENACCIVYANTWLWNQAHWQSTAKVRIAVIPMMDVNRGWNSTLELLE